MPNIVEIQVHWRDKSGDMHVIKERPTGEETAVIKLDVARIVQTVKDSGLAEYYYMVIKVRKSTGGFGYRTMIPKTMLNV